MSESRPVCLGQSRSVSVCFSLSQSVLVCISMSGYSSVYPSLSLDVSVCLCPFWSVLVHLRLPWLDPSRYVSFYFDLFRSVAVCLRLCQLVSVSPSSSPSVSVRLTLSYPISFCFSLARPVSVCLCLAPSCLSFPVFLSLFQSVSVYCHSLSFFGLVIVLSALHNFPKIF